MDIEAQRSMAFHCDLEEDLMVRHFTGSEKLGECFEYAVTLYSEKDDLKLETLLGTHATVEIRMDLPEPRYFDGIVCECSHLGRSETFEMYRVVLRPWLWLLTRTRGSEVFQKQTALDIARDLFGKGTGDKPATAKRAQKRTEFAEFSEDQLKNKGALPKWEYCLQFRETDFDFLSRVFEKTGIYYYFKHELGKHTLVLADGHLSHPAAGLPGFEVIKYGSLVDDDKPEVGQFLEWASTKQVKSGVARLDAYDFLHSRADNHVEKEKDPLTVKSHAHDDSELYDFPGYYLEKKDGEFFVETRIQEAVADHHVARGVTDSRGLTAGAQFSLLGHPREVENSEYTIVSTRYDFDSGSFFSGGPQTDPVMCYVTAIPSQVDYRPPRHTPVPFVPGPQSARVVGPKGQVFCSDDWGRIKIQFPWDRDGKYDENSSCWVRVSQGWAGAGMGSQHTPRIGQEVLVEFIDGDVDRPIVTGRLYNDVNPLPSDMKKQHSRSGWKSQTVQGNPDDYNEIRFEDKKGEEELFLRAQRDMNTIVLHDSATTIDNDHALTVSKGKSVTKVAEGKMTVSVPKSTFALDAKVIKETGTDSLTLKVGSSTISIHPHKIELTVDGSNNITIEPFGISINGTIVKINS